MLVDDKRKRLCWAFVGICLINILAIIVALLVTDGGFLKDVIWDGRSPLFIDFVTHIDRMADWRPYNITDYGARFPGLAYLFFGFLGRIIPSSIENSDVRDWYNLYMVIILCFNVMGISFIVSKFFKKVESGAIKFWILFAFFASAPFALAEVKAGNSAIYVLTLMLFALYLKDSDKRVYRELALILIAISAGFKISPAIFGFLYVKEKRWGEVVRLVIYGIFFFFVPYIFLGGMEGFTTFLKISEQVSGATNPRPETLIGVCLQLASVLHLGSATGLLIGKIVAFGYLIVVMILFFLSKKDWKSMALVSSLMIVFVNESYPYTMCYLFIPLIFMLKEKFMDSKENAKISRMDYIYIVLMGLAFTSYPFLRIDWPTATFITNYFWLYILLAVLVADKIREVIVLKKNR